MLIGLLIFGGSIYVAATLPMKWGGQVMQGWSKAGKKLWGNTGGAAIGLAGKGIKLGAKTGWERTGVPGGFKQWSSKMGEGSQRKSDAAANRLLFNKTGGKMGMEQESFERNQRAGVLSAESERFKFGDKKGFTDAYNNTEDEQQKRAILLAAMKAGMVDDNAITGIGHEEIGRLAENDDTGLIKTAAMKDNRESLLSSSHTSQQTKQQAADDIIKKFSSAKGGELRAVTKALAEGNVNLGETKYTDGSDSKGVGSYGSAIGQSSIDKLRQTNPDAANALSDFARKINGAVTQAEAHAENDARIAAATSSSGSGNPTGPSLAERKAAAEAQQNVHKNL